MLIAITLRLIGTDGSVILADLQQYSFAILVLVAIALAFQNDKHVKVEVFDINAPDHTKSGFGLFWMVLGVLAPMAVILLFVFPTVFTSWELLEGSRELGGLPGYFLVKTTLPVFCFVMILIALLKVRSLIRSTEQ